MAIKPCAADEKIKFIGASLCHLLKKGDKSYLCVINEMESISDGVIMYKDKVLDEAEKNMYQAYADGICFIN